MSRLQWNQRFFASTRGRIVMLLRRTSRTVDELAQALNLRDNAVRAPLATLERDGFVRQLGERRGNGKPAYIYELSLDSGQLFLLPQAEQTSSLGLQHSSMVYVYGFKNPIEWVKSFSHNG